MSALTAVQEQLLTVSDLIAQLERVVATEKPARPPELFRLLADAQPGDILLVDQVDRLSRLTSADWEKLKAELTARRVRVVALDLPTSWMMATNNADALSRPSTACCWTCWLPWLERITTIAADDRHKVKPKPRRRAVTRAVQKTLSAMPASQAFLWRAAPGPLSRI